MLQNIKIVLPLHCVFHGIRFKVGRLEVERLPSFFILNQKTREIQTHQNSVIKAITAVVFIFSRNECTKIGMLMTQHPYSYFEKI